MFKKLSAVFLKSSLVVVSCSLALPVFAQSAPESASDNGYPADFVQKNTDACVKNNTDRGVDPKLAQSQCSCFITQIHSQIPFEKFKSIVAEAQKSHQPSPELQAISQSCQPPK